MSIPRREATLALLLLLLLVGSMSGAALGRDQTRSERMTGDDDPVLMPLAASPDLWNVAT